MVGYKILGVTVKRASAKALLLTWPTNREGMWVPKSQLEAGTTVRQQGDKGVAVIASWLAEKEGLMDRQEKPDNEERYDSGGGDDLPPF